MVSTLPEACRLMWLQCFGVLPSLSWCQRAECIDLFPVPLPKPGFYPSPTSFTEFEACVPSTACPGVDAAAVADAYSVLLASVASGSRDMGTLLDALLNEFVGLGAGNVSMQVWACVSLGAAA